MRFTIPLRRLVTSTRTRMARLSAGNSRLVHAVCARADTPGGKLLLWALSTALQILVQHSAG